LSERKCVAPCHRTPPADSVIDATPILSIHLTRDDSGRVPGSGTGLRRIPW